MGTEASPGPTIHAHQAGTGLPDHGSPLGEPRPDRRQDEEAARRLSELLEMGRRSPKREVSAFVATPFGLQGVGVIGSSTEDALIMEVPIAAKDLPEEVTQAVDTIRFFLDGQLTAERDRMRRLLA